MVTIKDVQPGSAAARAGLQPGEAILSINRHPVTDLLDYRFYGTERRLILRVLGTDGKERRVKIKKEQYDDLGLEFDTFLMDKHRSCKNKCIFCFIDQLPKGLRPSLYFKDDDSRLSFLFGNYITLTNITDAEIDRIITMHISPVNISVHTTNPALRVQMMRNPHVGEALRYVEKLAKAGIKLNCQLVLCHGVNDGEELTRTMRDLSALYPSVESVAAVPVGITKFREGLAPVTPFDAQSAAAVIDAMEAFGDEMERCCGDRLFYPSDEFYNLAGREIPPLSFYGPLLQLENGVGMAALLKQEFYEACETYEGSPVPRHKTLATGVAAQPLIKSLVDYAAQKWHNISCDVVAVENDFFGHTITTAGLITGGDLIAQLQPREQLGELLIPACMLNREGTMFLDDKTPDEVSAALGVRVVPVASDGASLLEAILS